MSYIPIELLKTEQNYDNDDFSYECINTFKDEYLYNKKDNEDNEDVDNDTGNIINED